MASTSLPLTEEEHILADKQEALQAKHAASFGRGMHFAEKPAHSTEEQLVRFLATDQCNSDEETPGYPHVTIVPAALVQQPLHCSPPKPFGTGTVFIINLFSGQRRENDIQQQFEYLVANKYNVRILSVDIINDPKLGNLLNEDTIALWVSLFTARAIIGLACGPPCETFAAIRHCPLADGQPGPPPLRSRDYIWGLPSLSHKHGIQVTVAKKLYRTCILLMAKAKQVGAFGVLEHPDRATWQPLHPSSWLINQTKSMVDLSHADTSQIDQCSCGTDYRKPTRLMHVNLPGLPLRIAELPGAGRCTHAKHTKVLRGLDINGKFKTAPAKEYPPVFCKLIAAAMHDYVVQYLPSSSASFAEDCTELNEKLSKFYMPLDPYNEAHVTGAIGQDFAQSTSRPMTARQLAKREDKELYTINFPTPPHQVNREEAASQASQSNNAATVVLQNTPPSATAQSTAALKRARTVRAYASTHFGSDAGHKKPAFLSSDPEAEPVGFGESQTT